MSYSASIQAIKDHLSAVWTVTPLVWEGERFARPDDGSPFVLVEFGDAPSSIAAMGGGVTYRHRGNIELSVFVPEGQAGVAYEMAEQLAAKLRFVMIGDARLWEPSFGRLHVAEGDS